MFSFSIDKFFQKEWREFSFRRLLERIFVDDWVMKLIALTITLALWLGVTGLSTPKTERLRNVPLKLSISNEMEITNTPVEEVDLVVTGDKRKIEPIKSEDLIITLDLSDRQAGDQTIELTPENINIQNLPSGVKLEEIQPSKIAVKLELVEKSEIPVKAITTNDVPEGFEVYGISVVPARIPVRGPVSYVNSLDFISTERIDLENRRGDFTAQQVPLNISNSKITVIDETSVDVFFRIGEKRIERLFIVPVENMGENRTATLILYGPRSILNSLDKEDIEVEMTGKSTDEKNLKVGLPAGIQDKVERKKLQLNGK